MAFSSFRKFMKDVSHEGIIARALSVTPGAPPAACYAGFDVTADSLHVGHLLTLHVLRKMSERNVLPVLVLGGATTAVGDPTGRTQSRPVLSKDDIAANMEAIQAQLLRLMKGCKPVVFDNAEWVTPLTLMELITGIGRQVSMSSLLASQAVKTRLDSDGMTLTEFLYPIIQGFDFLTLAGRMHKMACPAFLQVGGSDQWGNMLAGTELIRKMRPDLEGFCAAFTHPLLLTKDGRKMGKTAGGATVWLDREKTSDLDFYQFWRNLNDCDARAMADMFLDEMPAHNTSAHVFNEPDIYEPSSTAFDINALKTRLALRMTTWVRGEEAAILSRELAENRIGSTGPAFDVVRAHLVDDFPALVVDLDLATTRSEVRRLMAQNGITLDGQPATTEVRRAAMGTVTLSRGKKRHQRLRIHE